MTKIGDIITALPVPDGAVALLGGRTGDRWQMHGGRWLNATQRSATGRTLGEVLHAEGNVTVEMAPPREPRTWEKLDAAEDLPAVVEVEGVGRWRRCTGVSWRYEPARFNHLAAPDDRATLEELRFMGEVREVLT